MIVYSVQYMDGIQHFEDEQEAGQFMADMKTWRCRPRDVKRVDIRTKAALVAYLNRIGDAP